MTQSFQDLMMQIHELKGSLHRLGSVCNGLYDRIEAKRPVHNISLGGGGWGADIAKVDDYGQLQTKGEFTLNAKAARKYGEWILENFPEEVE